MAHVQDLWEKTVSGRRIRTSRYGKGNRWQARYLDPDGRERTRTFERKQDAEQFVAPSAPTYFGGPTSIPTPARRPPVSQRRAAPLEARQTPTSTRPSKASLGHYLSYAGVLSELGIPGAGALTLSVYLLEPGRSPLEFRAGLFQRAYRTTSVGRVRAAEVPIWATDVTVEGQPLAHSADHFDLVVSTATDVLPDAYAAVEDKAERRRLRDLLRPRFDHVLALFDPPQPFGPPSRGAGNLDLGGA